MPITIADVNNLMRLLEEHPDWREVLQRRLFTEEASLHMLDENLETKRKCAAVFSARSFWTA